MNFAHPELLWLLTLVLPLAVWAIRGRRRAAEELAGAGAAGPAAARRHAGLVASRRLPDRRAGPAAVGTPARRRCRRATTSS